MKIYFISKLIIFIYEIFFNMRLISILLSINLTIYIFYVILYYFYNEQKILKI